MEKYSSKKNVVVGRHYPEVDGLRAIAILSVVWWHAVDIAAAVSSDVVQYSFKHFFYAFSAVGAAGVSIFFVISGFLITGILIDLSNQKGCFKTFYIRRSLRIFPVYYAALCAIALGLMFFQFPKTLDVWITYAFYMQNMLFLFVEETLSNATSPFLNHFWSLAVEEQFYLIWPFLFVFVFRRYNAVGALFLTIGLIVASLILRFSIFMMIEKNVQMASLVYYDIMPVRLSELGLGALLACMQKMGIIRKSAINKVFFFLMMGMTLIVLLYSMRDFSTVYAIKSTISLCVAFLTFCGIYEILSNTQERDFLYLRSRGLRSVATVSYAMYVVHMPIMSIAGFYLMSVENIGFSTAFLSLLLVGCTASYLAARVSYKILERPFLKLKDRLAQYDG